MEEHVISAGSYTMVIKQCIFQSVCQTCKDTYLLPPRAEPPLRQGEKPPLSYLDLITWVFSQNETLSGDPWLLLLEVPDLEYYHAFNRYTKTVFY